MKKSQVLWSVAITFSILPLLLYFYRFHLPLSTDHDIWGEFGSFLSGVYGSLAFMAVAYTTYITQRQFRAQNEDSVFYKVVDSMNNRISLAVIKADEKEYVAHQALKYISEKFYLVLMSECGKMARKKLCTEPEKMDDTHYLNLLLSIYGGAGIGRVENLKEELIARNSFNARWEHLKFYIGSNGFEPDKVRDVLNGIGSVYIYNVPFKERKQLYEAALNQVMESHGELLDGYLSNLLFVAQLARKGINSDSYGQLLNSQITRYEVIIIFYMLAGSMKLPHGSEAIKELGLLQRLGTFDCTSLMIDFPSTEQIAVEINKLFEPEEDGNQR